MDSNLTEHDVRKRNFSRMMAIEELRHRGARLGRDFFISGKNPTPENELKDLLVKDLRRRNASPTRPEPDSDDDTDSDSDESRAALPAATNQKRHGSACLSSRACACRSTGLVNRDTLS